MPLLGRRQWANYACRQAQVMPVGVVYAVLESTLARCVFSCLALAWRAATSSPLCSVSLASSAPSTSCITQTYNVRTPFACWPLSLLGFLASEAAMPQSFVSSNALEQAYQPSILKMDSTPGEQPRSNPLPVPCYSCHCHRAERC